MKIQMNDILVLCFFTMLFLGIVGGIKCLGCANVGPDNKCKTKPYECSASKQRFCFTKKISKLQKIVKIQRGCTSFCRSESRIKYGYIVNTWCCYRDYCNKLNVWY
ncbi:prostate stem cell antigen-like [Eublepharis macularius]|uniref:Prostate stem cell antigen-like n=1 Tax=Eublepharis macularius TaxID=481883 RepID=A0AA97LJZ2_EUBMA|nr:prostate stem cell antigen-like [Eublepharis macularius]